MTIKDVVLNSSVEEILLYITLDPDLKFQKTHNRHWDKASKKVYVLPRTTGYMSLNKLPMKMSEDVSL